MLSGPRHFLCHCRAVCTQSQHLLTNIFAPLMRDEGAKPESAGVSSLISWPCSIVCLYFGRRNSPHGRASGRQRSSNRVRVEQDHPQAWLLQCFCIHGRMSENYQIAHPDSSMPSRIQQSKMSLSSIKHMRSVGCHHHGWHLSLSSWWLALISCMVRALTGPMAGPLLDLGQANGHLLLSSSPAGKSICSVYVRGIQKWPRLWQETSPILKAWPLKGLSTLCSTAQMQMPCSLWHKSKAQGIAFPASKHQNHSLHALLSERMPLVVLRFLPATSS